MKNFFFLCWGWLQIVQLNAQITVTNTTFPSLGDTLRYRVNNTPPILNLGTVGGNQIWDFTQLQLGSNVVETIFQEAVSGTGAQNFPNATFLTATQVRETYYRKTSTVFEILGTSGNDQLNLGLNTAVKYTPPLAERYAPMNFFDIKNFETDVSYAVPIGDLADTLLGSLSGLVDSIRFRIHTNHLYVVDAWGTCRIPGGEFEVLRQKRNTITETSIEVRSFLGWIDLGGLLGEGGSGLLESIGKDTSLVFHFFSASEKEEIALVDARHTDEEVLSVKYKFIDNLTSINDLGADEMFFSVSPNPTSDIAYLHFNNLPNGNFQLLCSDTNGRIWKKDFSSESGNGKFELEAGNLPDGLYFCRILNENNLVVGSLKWMLLRHP